MARILLVEGEEIIRNQGAHILDFESGKAVQVDFGSGLKIVDVTTGEELSTWVFVMSTGGSIPVNVKTMMR